MYVLNVEKRNLTMKAKQLRKNGLVPMSVDGGDLTETLLLQLPQNHAIKLLKAKSKGAMVRLDLAGEMLNVLLKDISYNALSGQPENLSFQKLMADEVINSTVKIVLIHREATMMMIQQLVDEIPYRSLPAELVETLEIDISEMKGEHSIKIEDLPFAQNKNVEILMPGDTMVLNLIDSIKAQQAAVEAEAV